jgi:hypothetical protein
MPTTAVTKKRAPRKSPQSTAAPNASPASEPAVTAAPAAAEAPRQGRHPSRRAARRQEPPPRGHGPAHQFEILMACAGQTVPRPSGAPRRRR